MKKPRKIPLRKCVVTQERHPKQLLLRVVRTPENNVEVDLSGKKNGRGVYISKSLSVLEKAKKKQLLSKHLDVTVPDRIYEELKEIIKQEI
jgi:predicted RNA-binding protein YlxR (DUF448 family)